MAKFKQIHIDDVEPGVMIYDAARLPLGVVRLHRAGNGNGAPIPCRHLDNGKSADRFAYRREGLYRQAKGHNGGQVLIKRSDKCSTSTK